MILIQVILIVAILAILLRFLSSRNTYQTQAWKKILLLLFAVFAIVVILAPGILDDVANKVGVGRGADLLLYGLTVAFIFERFNSYIKDKEEQKRFVTLARKVAISEALIENKDQRRRK